jgi:hypothetical protein
MADPLNSLQNILDARLTVSLESDVPLIAMVERRIRVLAEKGRTTAYKRPLIVGTLEGKRSWTIRPIDLLRRIGEETTPPFLPSQNMARLSASWATLRYFWAIDPWLGQGGPLRLSAEARDLDFHQKTLLSDEFGIGIGALCMEEYFGAAKCLDLSYVLAQSGSFQGLTLTQSTSPDYLMWGPQPTYYVVECKGSQSSERQAIDQIRRGLEQVVSVRFASGPYNSETLVACTFLDNAGTRVFLVDPPDEDGPSEGESHRVRRILIEDAEAFATRVAADNHARLLSWAGLYRRAGVVGHALGQPVPSVDVVERPTEVRKTTNGPYVGTVSPLFPQLGRDGLALFTGVRPHLTEPAKDYRDATWGFDVRGSEPSTVEHDIPSNISWGRNGTCMIVEGL